MPDGSAADRRHLDMVNRDNLFTVPKAALVRYRGMLDSGELRRLDQALRVALALD